MDTRSPVPPLLVAEGYDLTFFRSQQGLGGELEPWFVEVEHQAWDGLGRRLELAVVEPPYQPASALLKWTPSGTSDRGAPQRLTSAGER